MIWMPRCGVSTGAAWVPAFASLPLGETKTAEPAAPGTLSAKVTEIVALLWRLGSTHVEAVPVQEGLPAQLAMENPVLALAVIVTVSPTGTTHLATGPLQPAAVFGSLTVAVPSRPAVATTVTVGVTANLAVSVSVCEAVRSTRVDGGTTPA